MKSRAVAAALLLIVVAACQPAKPATTRAKFVGASLPACAEDPSWRCGKVTVPLDRKHPAAGTIPIAYYVQRRLDSTHAGLEPVFTTPGGPGGSIWAQRGGIHNRTWLVSHDTVLVERRGVGKSGGILCSDLQDGAATADDLLKATSACAAQLGAVAGRYGTGDVALDIEAVRKTLGIGSFDFYGGSYATLAAQAYVARFPNRVHALVLDSGWSAIDAPHQLYSLLVTPAFRVLDLQCSRSQACAAAYPHPDQVLERATVQLQGHPLQVQGRTPIGAADAWRLLGGLGTSPDAVQPQAYLDALTALLAGAPAKFEALVPAGQPHALDPADPKKFSSGDSVASSCADVAPWLPWPAADSVATRRAKVAAAIAAIDPATYAPLTRADVESVAPVEQCLAWPVEAGIEPVVPLGTKFSAQLPVLVLSGDVDLDAPTESSRLLLQEFPQGTFVVVAGAGHVSSDPAWGGCGDQVVTTFFRTLHADPKACSTPA